MEATDAELKQAMDNCIKQVLHNMPAFEVNFPDANSEGNFYTPGGNPERGATAQGYKDSSAWARGQSWGIYGTAIAYKNTGRDEYFGYFKGVADYFLRHLPDDICPFWDLSFGNGDDDEQPRDSSTAAIVACGFLEMAKHLPEEESGTMSLWQRGCWPA